MAKDNRASGQAGAEMGRFQRFLCELSFKSNPTHQTRTHSAWLASLSVSLNINKQGNLQSRRTLCLSLCNNSRDKCKLRRPIQPFIAEFISKA